MENKVILEDSVSSVVSRGELPSFLKKFSDDKGYPIGRVRWHEGQERFLGYGQGYLVAAKQRPPIPGGWILTIEKAKVEKRIIWISESLLRPVPTESGLPRLLDSYTQEGLEFEETKNEEIHYDTPGTVFFVKGHPQLIDSFEVVLDGF